MCIASSQAIEQNSFIQWGGAIVAESVATSAIGIVLRSNLPPRFPSDGPRAVGFAGQTAAAETIVGVVYSEGSNERVVHASVWLYTAAG
jgi:hypothetical protein